MSQKKPLNESQKKALDVLVRYPYDWHSPGAYSLPWQSFEALHRRRLADKLPETRITPVQYRLRPETTLTTKGERPWVP